MNILFLTRTFIFQVKSYNKQSRKYILEFIDDSDSTLHVSERNVLPFSKEPSFTVPSTMKDLWEKDQKRACTMFGNMFFLGSGGDGCGGCKFKIYIDTFVKCTS